MIDGRKNYVSTHLDILIEMVAVHHVQSLDLNKFYVRRDKESSRQEPYKNGIFMLVIIQKKPMQMLQFYFVHVFWHSTQLIRTSPKALSSGWTDLVRPTRCLTK